MSINDRVKLVRNALELTQVDFGGKTGISQGHLTAIESGKRAVTPKTVKVICATFGVNEEWLEAGKGEMFTSMGHFSLDKYAKANGLSALELDIIKTYMELPPKTRQAALAVLRQMFGRSPEEAEIEVETASYKQELEAEKFTRNCFSFTRAKRRLGK